MKKRPSFSLTFLIGAAALSVLVGTYTFNSTKKALVTNPSSIEIYSADQHSSPASSPIQITRDSDVPAGSTPDETLERYYQVVQILNPRQDLDIYDPRYLKFVNKTPTATQLRVSAQMGETCAPLRRQTKYNVGKTRAAIFFHLDNRRCSPFFFIKGSDGKWRMDRLALGFGITFTKENAYWIDFRPQSADKADLIRYDFAFQDLQVSRFGNSPYQFWPHQLGHWGAKLDWGYGIEVKSTPPEGSSPLLEGDIILSWDGNPIKPVYTHSVFERFEDYLRHPVSSQPIPITLLRSGKTVTTILYTPEGDPIHRWGFEYKVADALGLAVQTLLPDSPLRIMGVQEGDIILSINNTKPIVNKNKGIRNASPILNLIENAPAGSPLTITLARKKDDGTYHSIQIKGAAPEFLEHAAYY